MPRTRRTEPRSLIEQIEGHEQDDHAALWAAWVRVLELADRRQRTATTTLHVETLLFWIRAIDADGRGAQKTAKEVADRLRCKPDLARDVIARARDEFGLLLVTTTRYASGSQAANRYRINWEAVRRINRGELTAPAESAEPEATPAAVTEPEPPRVLPYGGGAKPEPPSAKPEPPRVKPDHNKEPIRPSIRTNKRPSPPTPSERPTGWQEVEAVILAFPKERRLTCWQRGIRAARRSGVTPGHVLEIIEHYQNTPGYSPGALFRRLQNCHPQLPAVEGWVEPLPAAAPVRKETTADEGRRVAQRIERDIIRASRAQGADDATIRRRIAEALTARRIPFECSDWLKPSTVTA